MACACKVNQQITYLQKKYGTQMPKSGKVKYREPLTLKDLLNKFLLLLIGLILTPLIFIYLLFRPLWTNKPISIKKILTFWKKND